MKILLITNLYPNKFDHNWGIFNFQQFNALGKLCDISAIVPTPWITPKNWKESGNEQLKYREYFKVHRPKYYYTPRVLRCFYGLFYFFSIFFVASKIIVKNKPDAIMATWAFPDGFASILLGKIYRVPVYIKVHGSDIHSVEGKCRKKLTAWTLKSCAKIISVSKSLSATMQQKFNVSKDKIFVIPNGIFKDIFSPMLKDDVVNKINIDNLHEKNIVFVGNLKPVKNLMALVEAFAKLSQGHSSSIGLHILGSGEMRGELETYIDKHNLKQCVFLHGKTPHEEIPLWMNYADLFVLPSKNEGMPNVVLEALSCGTPVVASNIEATQEIIDDGINGYLFDLQDLGDFVNKLKLGLELKQAPEFDHKHDMIISWQENARRLHQIIA